MRRREFITLLGGAATWPLAARAQQSNNVRRIGVLLPFAADDAEAQARVGAFLQALALLGWDHRPQRANGHPLDLGGRPPWWRPSCPRPRCGNALMLAWTRARPS